MKHSALVLNLFAAFVLTVPSVAFAGARTCDELFRAISDMRIQRDAPVDIIHSVVDTPFHVVMPEDFAHVSFGGDFLTLANKHELLSQDDPRLVTEGLAFDHKGGICGPTCITNIGKTGTIHDPNSRTVDVILKNLLDNYRRDTGTDGRMGTYPDQLMQAADELPEFKGTRQTQLSQDELSSRGIAKSLTAANQVLVAAVQFPGDGGHVILILKIEPTAKTVIVADPNYPNNVYRTTFRESKFPDGSTKFEFDLIGNYSHDHSIVHNWVTLDGGTVVNWPSVNLH